MAVVPAPILAEVWRGAPQSRLAQALKAMVIEDCTEAIAKRAGMLLSATGGKNALDAIVVATAEARGCGVITGDLKDLRALAVHTPGVLVTGGT